MKIVASYRTDVGTFRKTNQDAFLYLQNHTGQVLAAVCDGLGGHHCGEIASNMSIKMLKQFFNQADWKTLNNDKLIYDWLKNVIKTIQTAMNNYSEIHHEAEDMGTTMVMILITNQKAYFVNIGDSRIYYFYQDELRQITTDHNVLNLYLQRDKEILAATNNLLDKTYWKALTSALGPVKSLKIDITDMKLTNSCYFLLTSDGVHDFLEPWEIIHILEKNSSLKAKVKALIKTAISNVSTDNLTALLLEIKVE